MALQSFGQDITAVVFGASGGIGSAVVEVLRNDPAVARLHTVARGDSAEHQCDYRDENSIAAVARDIAEGGAVHLVFTAIGVLHTNEIQPEKTWRTLDPGAMAEAFAINAIAPSMIAKYMLPHLAKDRKTALAALSARVGSISDNRLGGWISYRASKAALNMAIKTLSIELHRTNPEALILGLHPGTVDTDLSRPFTAGKTSRRLFTPEQSAHKLLSTIDQAGIETSGNLLSYDGSVILP